MKIGFDMSQTGKGKSGCGYFADSLIREIAQLDKENQYLMYRTFGDFYWDLDFDKIEGIHQSNFSWGKQHETLDEARIFWKQSIDRIKDELGSPKLLQSNNYFCPEKKIPETKLIYTLYDVSFVDYPEWATEQNRVLCFDNIFNASLVADHMIAISDYSKKHFLDIFPHYPAEKISVVSLASRYQRKESVKKADRLAALSSGQFWLSVGTIEPRKNHKLLLEAYATLKRALQSSGKKLFPLVLAGGMGWLMSDFEKCLTELDLKEEVIWLGYTDEQELQWLYQHCYCFIYPSLFEGFGLPVLEAMSCGAPVITSNTSSIPEITGKDAAILIDPTKVNTLYEAMKDCVEGKISLSDLSQKAIKRSSLFSWKKSAEQVLAVYEKM